MNKWLYAIIIILSGLVISNFFNSKTPEPPPFEPQITKRSTKKPKKKIKPDFSTEYVNGAANTEEFIVRNVILTSIADLDNFKRLAPRYDVLITGTIDEVFLIQVKFKSLSLFNELMSLFPGRNEIVEPRIITTPKPIEATKPTVIGQPISFSIPPNAGKGMVIAVLDSGVADLPIFKHPVRHLDFIEGKGKEVRDKAGNLVRNHGTAVASLIAGTKAPVLGLAPDAQILDVRVMNDEGKGHPFTIALGVIAAINNGATIINMSIGTPEDSPIIEKAISLAHERDIIVVAASGNESQTPILCPARIPDVFAVGAVDEKNRIAKFSNTGENLDLTAPGVNQTVFDHKGKIVYLSGTSFAAPIVSGAIAVLKGKDPLLPAGDIYNLLLESCDEVGALGHDPIYGDGIFKVHRFFPKEGYTDLAIANVQAEKESGKLNLLVSVENRGTEFVRTATLSVTVGTVQQSFQLRDLEPGQLYFSTVPLSMRKRLSVSASVKLDLGDDSIGSNNSVRGSLEIQ